MKQVLLIAFMLAMVPTVSAQTSTSAAGASECKLKLAQAPVIRGIRLGMTVNEVLAVFPGAEKDEALRQQLSQTHFGSTTVSVWPFKYASKEKFLGVDYVTVGLLDGELNSFTVTYRGPVWNTSDQFALKVAEALRLPALEFWKDAGTAIKFLRCDGFEVRTQMSPESGSNSIFVKNRERDAAQTIRERDEAVKEQARRAFKP